MRKIHYASLLAKVLIWSKHNSAMIFGFICTKRKANNPMPAEVEQHENIHAEQYAEITAIAFLAAIALSFVFSSCTPFIFVPFVYYIIYFVEGAISYLVRFCFRRATDAVQQAYLHSMFEQEAHAGEAIPGYIQNRRRGAWLKYFGQI